MTTGQRVDPNAKVTLTKLVNLLEDTLKKSTFLTGDKVNSSDLAIWSLLAPESSLKGCENIDNVLKWYRTMSALPEVQESLKVMPLKSLNFSSLLQANHFGGLHHVQLIPNVITEMKNKSSAEPTATVADTITPEELEMAKNCFIFVQQIKKDDPKIM